MPSKRDTTSRRCLVGCRYRYIVKQITKREKNTLMSILPAYKQFVQQRQGCSLLQYLSCHSMRLRWQWSGKVYFVVMRNFLPMRPVT